MPRSPIVRWPGVRTLESAVIFSNYVIHFFDYCIVTVINKGSWLECPAVEENGETEESEENVEMARGDQ